ncbi:MAG: hypothetical protein LC687_04490 [Actinobacteria bacterium]|nr:hypothetical protein [Actinomycetota bacterium]
MGRHRLRIATLCLAAVIGLAGAGMSGAAHAGHAEFFRGHVFPYYDRGPLEDQLEIIEREYELVAIDAWSGFASVVELGISEEVLWTAVRGRIGLAVTNRRALSIVPASSGWQEREFRPNESGPERIVLGDRVALVITDRRVLAVDGMSGNWSQSDLGPRERVLSAAAGTNVAVAVTRTRVIGTAAGFGGLYEEDLGIREEAQALRVHGSFATVTTRRRFLTFRGNDASWQSTEPSLR